MILTLEVKMRFCSVCNSILNSSTVTGQLIFVCNKCWQKESSNDKDTLMYNLQISNEDTDMKFENFIRNAAFDPTNPTLKKDCVKCKNDVMTYVRIGADMRLIYICKCGYIELIS